MPEVSYATELRRVLDDAEARRVAADDSLHGEPTIEYETVGEPVPTHLVSPPPSFGHVTLQNLFSHPDAHPLVLDLVLLHRYGADWLGWEPETIQNHTGVDLGQISDINFSKVMALKALHLVDHFWQRWEIFVWCAMPLNGFYPDFQMMQVPSVAQCAVAVDISKRIREDVPWSSELKKYLEIVYRHDNLFCPEPPLEFVEVDSTGIVDCAEVRKRWPDVRISRHAPTEHGDVEEQLRRMLVVYEHLTESRDRLRAQSRLLPIA